MQLHLQVLDFHKGPGESLRIRISHIVSQRKKSIMKGKVQMLDLLKISSQNSFSINSY